MENSTTGTAKKQCTQKEREEGRKKGRKLGEKRGAKTHTHSSRAINPAPPHTRMFTSVNVYPILSLFRNAHP